MVMLQSSETARERDSEIERQQDQISLPFGFEKPGKRETQRVREMLCTQIWQSNF